MRQFFYLLFFAALIYFLNFVVRQDSKWLSAIWQELPFAEPQLTENYQANFRQAVITQANVYRGKAGVPRSLTEDEEIQAALANFIAGSDGARGIDLDDLFRQLRDRFPETQTLSATMLFDPRDAKLQADLSSWSDTQKADFDSLSVMLFNAGIRRGALAVLTKRLPVFDLSSVDSQQGRFHRTCPLCQTPHAIDLEKADRTLILKCPHCRQSYDMIAGGSDGRFRHANEFLQGFTIPVSPEVRGDSYATMVEIWYRVLKECVYENDRDEYNRLKEAWKPSRRTWSDKAGDCEDTSILLADALISAGIEARVAVGRNIHIGEHAWCVARINGKQYVLESTGDYHASRQPMPVAQAADEFRPEQLFDRETLYFSRQEGQHPCADYWSEQRWRGWQVQ